MEYLVTTHKEDLFGIGPIAMLDGTVPGWTPGDFDLHYDHHIGGSPIQIDGMRCHVNFSGTIVTTQVDADACVAAAYVQVGDYIPTESFEKFRAIAWDCDHLYCPPELAHLSEFAAKAVAALKAEGFKIPAQLGYPTDRRGWTDEQKRTAASLSFEQGTEWLMAAAFGDRPWPGENGEADQYWEQVEADTQMFLNDPERMRLVSCVPVFSTQGINRYIDPRAPLRALERKGWATLPITLTVRDRKDAGLSYTLGSVPGHPALSQIDFCRDGVFDALTDAERPFWPEPETIDIPDEENPPMPQIKTYDGWGGRATVGGSGWNTPSHLSPERVIEIALDKCTKGDQTNDTH